MRENNFFRQNIVKLYNFLKIKTMMKEADAIILFHIPFGLKENLAAAAKHRKISMTKLINHFIADCLEKKVITTGRGHKNVDQLDGAIKFFRMKHPKEITPIELAHHLKCQQARAMRLIDLLSGNEADGDIREDFLVYSNDDASPTRYGIFRDSLMGIHAV
jgi:hypothetical protein